MAAKSSGRKYGRKASSKVKRAMHERKRGTLRSGRSGKKVKSRKQAIAIGLSEARRSGHKVPSRKKKSHHRRKRKSHSSAKNRSQHHRAASQSGRRTSRKTRSESRNRHPVPRTEKHYFVEETPDDNFAIRTKESERASDVLDTQGEAIERVGELNPDDHPDIEHIRNTSAGSRDKWRSSSGGSDG